MYIITDNSTTVSNMKRNHSFCLLNRNMRKLHKGMTNKRRDLLERWHGDREGSKKEAVQLQGISQRG